MNELSELIDMLAQIAKSETLVVVEGINDKRALSLHNINKVKTLSRRALYKVVEEIVRTDKRVIILTDLDKEGKKLFRILNSDLVQRGVYVDKNPREFLFKNTKLRQIEGLTNYIKNLKKKS